MNLAHQPAPMPAPAPSRQRRPIVESDDNIFVAEQYLDRAMALLAPAPRATTARRNERTQ